MIFNHKVWLSWNQQSCVHFLYLTLQAAREDLPRHFGFSWPLTILCFERDQVYWLNRWEELRALGFKILDCLLIPGYARFFYDEEFPAKCKELEAATAAVGARDLRRLTASEVLKEYTAFVEIYRAWYALGWYAEPVQFCAESLMEDELRYLRDSGRLDERSLAEGKVHLYNSLEPTYAAEIEDSLFAAAQQLFQAAASEGLRLQWVRGTEGDAGGVLVVPVAGHAHEGETGRLSLARFNEEYLRQRASFASARKAIEDHAARFFWKRNNYHSTQVVTPLDVLSECLAVAKDGIAKDFGKLIGASTRRILENRPLRDKLYRELRPFYRSVVDVLSRNARMKDLRKQVICQANHAIDLFLREVARRTGYKVEEVRRLLPVELEECLGDGGTTLREEVNRRGETVVVFWGEQDTAPPAFTSNLALRAPEGIRSHRVPAEWRMSDSAIASGEKAREFMRALNDKFMFLLDWGRGQEIAAITGECVFYIPGEEEIRGVVHVVSDPKAADDFAEGEILVAPSTTPDYVPLMRRARCIITDWGGWTSHAALVAREMGKPCIIGSYHASQVLNSGERVVIRVREGIVLPERTLTRNT